jgi:hypothetical protein
MFLILAVCAAAAAWAYAEIVRFTADKVTYKMSSPRQILLLGRAVVHSGTNIIRADKIQIAGKDLDEALCTGRVEILDQESGTVLRSQRVEYFQQNDYIRLLTEPVLESKGVVIRSGEMERYNALRLAFIQGPSVIERSNVRVRCLQGRYEEDARIARVRGDVETEFNTDRTGPTGPDRVSGGEMILYMDKDRLILGRDVRGTVYFDE